MNKSTIPRNIKLANNLQSLISKIIEKEHRPIDNTIITVTEVVINPALTQANVFISVFPDTQAQQVLENIQKHIYTIQQQINKQCQIRTVPKIVFKIDTSPAKIDKIEQLILEDKKRHTSK
ncbi:MAG TPA: 30S ribosome-binding factor RbfA [Candidatus Paceibacterota bacterium]|jgi:ribosome-binding factor A|nr:30S ribosome-binding factor RbfA [Candidatus Paceibacterota bacterium]